MKIFGLVIMTEKKLSKVTYDAYCLGEEEGSDLERHSIYTAINPVIHDLEKLRANTWDQDKITHIQNWLRDNFEV